MRICSFSCAVGIEENELFYEENLFMKSECKGELDVRRLLQIMECTSEGYR